MVAVLAVAFTPACSQQPPSPDDASAPANLDARERFVAAFQSEQYETALEIADERLRGSPTDGEFLTYRGMALSCLGRHEEAAEVMRRASHAEPRMAADRMALFLRSTSLFHQRMYARAQELLDELAKAFPSSFISERGQELAIRIEQRLSAGVSRTNLNWYVAKAIQATVASRPALAIEYYEEYLLLAKRVEGGSSRDEDVQLGLGAAYLDIGAAAQAERHLARVRADYEGYRAGMLYGLALVAVGKRSQARETFEMISTKADSEAMRLAAKEYLRTF